MLKKLGILSLVVVASMGINAKEMGKYEGKLEETVVTATGFEASQNDQIKNITIITNQDIQNRGYNSVEDVLRNTPGITFTHNNFGFVADIRGQGKEEALKRVKVLVDGVQMNILDVSHGFTPVNTLSVENIERIEIINGGGSVVYGGGTSGGVINIITKNTQKEDVKGKIYYQNSSFATNKYGVSTGIKFSDNFLVDLGYEKINGKGYRNGDEKESDNLNGSFVYKISDNQTLKFGTKRFEQDYKESSSITEKQLLLDRKTQGDTKTDGAVKRSEYTLGYNVKATDNLIFDVVAYKQKTNRKYIQKTDSSMSMMGVSLPYTQDTNALFVDKKDGINLKGNYKFNRGSVVIGYDYMKNSALRQATNITSYTIPAGMMRPGSPARPMRHVTTPIVKLEKVTNSIFFINKLSLTDNVESTIGYRYENAKYDINRKNNTGELKTKKSTNNSSYEVGLNYKYSATGNIYGKYENGFRSPSPTEMTDGLNRVYIPNNVKNETFNTYEIGIKDMIGNSYVSATAFLTDTKNEIHTTMLRHGITWKTENIQRTERKGLELFAEQYFNKLRINESLSYVDAKISKGENKGDKISYVPKVKATLGLVYDINDKISLSSDLNYHSKAVDSGNKKIKGHTITNIGLSYKTNSGFGLQAGIKNVFGKKYFLYENISTNSYTPAPERTYFLGVSYDF